MEAIELLKEAEKMIKELQDAYVRHDGAVALRRKIRKFVAAKQSVQSDGAIGSCECDPFDNDVIKPCSACGKPRR